MTKNAVKLIPLGGLSEIGQNMMVLVYGEDHLIIDCGLMFPDHEHFGVDIIIPDFSYVLDKKITGIVITHGHEDHIGALSHLLKELKTPPPIYAPRFAKALIHQRLEEAGLPTIKIHQIQEGDILHLGEFLVQCFFTVHSIIDSLCLLIKTPAGKIFHTGDFKFDPHLPDHQEKIKKIGDQGIDLLLADSTNIERDGSSLSEKDIKDNFDKIFAQEKGRIFLSVFASNLQRISNFLELAQKHKRKVYLDGRSMIGNCAIARELGILTKTDMIVSDIPKKDAHCIFLITGSQAEPYASLTRLAYGSHAELKLKQGDLVILSSRFIPGNERAIHKLMNNIAKQGARILYGEISDIHTSGHAHRDELRKLHEFIRPRFFIPIHGETRHLHMHAALAQEFLPEESIVIAYNGDVLELTQNSLKKLDHLDLTPNYLDRITGDSLEPIVLRERKKLSETGILIAILVCDKKTLSLKDIYLYSRGFFSKDKYPHIFEALEKEVCDLYVSHQNETEIEELIRVGLRRSLKHRNLKLPIVMPVIIAG